MRREILVRDRAESEEAQLFAHLMGYVWRSERNRRTFKILTFPTPTSIFMDKSDKSMTYDDSCEGAISYKRFFKLVEVV